MTDHNEPWNCCPADLPSWAIGFAAGHDAGVEWARDQMDLALMRAVDPGPLVEAHQRAMVNSRQAVDVVRRLVRVMSRSVPQ